MGTVYDYANFFIDVALHNEEDCMTNLRLNKLLYFSQAWALAKLGRPLFNEKIKAWKLGPVVPEIYRKYKPCSDNPINHIDGDYSFESFSPEEKDLLIDVMREYGQYSTPKLVDITHEDDSPWFKAYNSKDSEITQKQMRNYFTSKKMRSFDEQIDIEKGMIGHLDEKGIPVLPADFDEDWDA